VGISEGGAVHVAMGGRRTVFFFDCELHLRLQSPQVTAEDCPKTLLRDMEPDGNAARGSYGLPPSSPIASHSLATVGGECEFPQCVRLLALNNTRMVQTLTARPLACCGQ